MLKDDYNTAMLCFSTTIHLTLYIATLQAVGLVELDFVDSVPKFSSHIENVLIIGNGNAIKDICANLFAFFVWPQHAKVVLFFSFARVRIDD